MIEHLIDERAFNVKTKSQPLGPLQGTWKTLP